jgi:putative transposase
MQWLLTSHVRRIIATTRQWTCLARRFKAFPIEQDDHLLTVLRYVERNLLRANLVRRAEAWPWSSMSWRNSGKRPVILSDWPVPYPRNWLARVNAIETDVEPAALRRSMARGAPFGDQRWSERIAKRLGLESTLRPRGRPKAEK